MAFQAGVAERKMLGIKESVSEAVDRAIKGIEYSLELNKAQEALLQSILPIITASETGDWSPSAQAVQDAVATQTTLAAYGIEQMHLEAEAQGIPIQALLTPQLYRFDPSVRHAINAAMDRVQKSTFETLELLADRAPHLHPEIQMETIGQRMAEDGIAEPVYKTRKNTGTKARRLDKIYAEQHSVFNTSTDREAFQAQLVAALARSKSARFAQMLVSSDIPGGNIVNAIRRSIQHPDDQFRQMNHIISTLARDPKVLRAYSGDISKLFGKMTSRENPQNEEMFHHFDKMKTSAQIDTILMALGEYDEQSVQMSPGRAKETKASLTILAKLMDVAPDEFCGAVQSWERQVSRLFSEKGNAADKQVYTQLSSRQRAALLALSLNNTMGIEAKIRYLQQEPQLIAMLNAISQSTHAERFSGWQDAAAIVALTRNWAAKQVSERKPRESKIARQFGEQRNPGDPPPGKKSHRGLVYTIVGVAGVLTVAVLVASACSPHNNTPGVTPEPTAQGEPTLIPAATPTEAPVAILSPTPPAVETAVPGLLIAAPGGAPAGGEFIYNNRALQDAINREQYAVVYYDDPLSNNNVISALMVDKAGNATCYVSPVDTMFSDDLRPLHKVGDDGGFFSEYAANDDSAPEYIILNAVDISGFPRNIACVHAIGREPGTEEYRKDFILLIDKDTNAVIGQLPSVFLAGKAEASVDENGRLVVKNIDGEVLKWLKLHSDIELPPFVPAPLTKSQLSAVDAEHFQDYFTPMTQTDFEELNALLLTNPNNINFENADPVKVFVRNSNATARRMGIEGTVGVNIFPQYLNNVDGQLMMSMLIVVNDNGVNKLKPVTVWFSMDSASDATDQPAALKELGVRSGEVILEFFIDFEDGRTPVEANFVDGVIDDITWTQPLPFRGVSH